MAKKQKINHGVVYQNNVIINGYELLTLIPISKYENKDEQDIRETQLKNVLNCFTQYFNLLESLKKFDIQYETYNGTMLKDSIHFVNFIIAFIFHNLNIILDNENYFENFKPIFENISNILNTIQREYQSVGTINYVELTKYNNISKNILEEARDKIFRNLKSQKRDSNRSFVKKNINADFIPNHTLIAMFDELQKYKSNLYTDTIVKGRGKVPIKKKIKTNKQKFNFKKLKKHITKTLKPRIKTISKPKKNKPKLNKTKKN